MRSPIAADVPTMQEAGFPDFSADAWFGLVAPAGTPASIVSRLQAEVAKLLKEPALRKTMTELGMVPVGKTPAEFTRLIEQESAYWARIIERMGLKVQ
jgi:tripartite-type tricarboxylate transporter receptor subunit TctC